VSNSKLCTAYKTSFVVTKILNGKSTMYTRPTEPSNPHIWRPPHYPTSTQFANNPGRGINTLGLCTIHGACYGPFPPQNCMHWCDIPAGIFPEVVDLWDSPFSRCSWRRHRWCTHSAVDFLDRGKTVLVTKMWHTCSFITWCRFGTQC